MSSRNLLWIFIFFLITSLVVALHHSCYRLVFDPKKYDLIKLIGYTPPDGFYTYNPSVLYDKIRNRIYFSIRVSNKGCDTDPLVVQNMLLMIYVNVTRLEDLKPEKIIESRLHRNIHPPVGGCCNTGIEDIRLWSHQGELYGIGSYVMNTTPVGDKTNVQIQPTCKNRMVIVKFDPDSLEIIETIQVSYGNGRNEKNWAPVIGPIEKDLQHRLPLFVYNWDPYIVIAWDPSCIAGGKMTQWKSETITDMTNRGVVNISNLKNCRGGSQVVYTSDQGYMAVVHTRDIAGKNYRHYLVYLDTNLDITAVSDSFCIDMQTSDPTLCGIEFVSGAAEITDGTVVVTYGAKDCTANVAVLDITTSI